MSSRPYSRYTAAPPHAPEKAQPPHHARSTPDPHAQPAGRRGPKKKRGEGAAGGDRGGPERGTARGANKGDKKTRQQRQQRADSRPRPQPAVLPVIIPVCTSPNRGIHGFHGHGSKDRARGRVYDRLCGYDINLSRIGRCGIISPPDLSPGGKRELKGAIRHNRSPHQPKGPHPHFPI